jgi:hypothetical protein
MDVSRVTEIVLLMLFPTLVVEGALHLPGGIRRARRLAEARHPDTNLQPSHPPIEQLAADLRRLLRQHDAIRQAPGMAMRGRHLRALEGAITDCAVEAASALGLPYPDRPAHGALSRPQLRHLLDTLTSSGLTLPPATGFLAA